MKITAIATKKGGAGKTTLATNLAVESANAGYKTLIIDLDVDQRTALNWFNMRENRGNPLVVSPENIGKFTDLLEAAKERIDRVFIDTQGAESDLGNAAMKCADFVLIPCKSSGFDSAAQKTTAQTVLTLKKEAGFVITQAPARGQEVQRTKEILSGFGVPIYQGQISQLKIYKEAALFASTAIEDEPKGKGAEEIEALFQWVENRMDVDPLLSELQGAVCDEH